MKYLAILIVVGLVGYLPGIAQANAAPVLELAQVDEKKEKKKKDKRVCKRVKVTGSRIPERICKKQSQWDRELDATRENVERTFEEGNRSLGTADG